jgi:environmental stress-induced protein Ves
MAYNIEIIKKNQCKTSKWSGGTTTELYIYPNNAMYSERTFKWRLSSARVEDEESMFTSLPGIHRIIMVIEGELRLEHKGHHDATLKAFEQDRFSGDWTTKSFGKVIDFNLMMTKGCSGKVDVISINSGEAKDILLYNNIGNEEKTFQTTEVFYLVEGEVEIITETYEKTKLNEGDLVLVTKIDSLNTSEFKIHSKGEKEAKIIRASIFC